MVFWRRLLPGIAFAALVVVAFVVGFEVEIPVYAEGDWRTDGFIRGVVENQTLISEHYGPKASATFTTLRVLSLPVVVLSCLLLMAYAGPVANYFEAHGKPVAFACFALLAAFVTAGLVSVVFYSPDALGISGYARARRMPSNNADTALANFWFTKVAMLPLAGLWLAASALAVVRAHLRMSADRAEP